MDNAHHYAHICFQQLVPTKVGKWGQETYGWLIRDFGTSLITFWSTRFALICFPSFSFSLSDDIFVWGSTVIVILMKSLFFSHFHWSTFFYLLEIASGLTTTWFDCFYFRPDLIHPEKMRLYSKVVTWSHLFLSLYAVFTGSQ